MSQTSSLGESRNQRLEQALAEYLRSVEAGQPVDRHEVLARYPDLVEELQSFFHNRDAIEQLARPLQDAAGKIAAGDEPTIALGSEDRTGQEVAPRVRYFGDYELLSEIARGGMGVVYKARQESLKRIVALKMILSGQLASAEDVSRFHQEAEAAANLDHPHIVPIYEIGEHQGQHYFSMKLIEGGSLAQLLHATPNGLQLRDAARLMSTVARAVHHAHQRGLLHRDLKPSNILLDAAGEPHVTDFGLATRVEGDAGITRTGSIVGTPNYMSPEQARAQKQISTAADVYSLGAVLYALLTGQPPFHSETAVDTIMQVVSREPRRPRSLNPRIDRDLETIALKCLEKEPQRRYDSAAALADDLERWLRGEPILSRPSTRWEQAAKWARRKPAAAALVLVSSLAVVVFILVLAASNLQIRRAAAVATAAQGQAETAARLAERRLYGAQILLAQATLEQAQIGQTQQALSRTAPEFRGWEWDYLHAVSDTSKRTIQLPYRPHVLYFSADAKALGSAGEYNGPSFLGAFWLDLQALDNTLTPDRARKQNADTGYGYVAPSPVSNVAFTDDLHRCAIYSKSGLEVWDTRADQRWPLGERLKTEEKGQGNNLANPVMGAVAFSADAKQVFCAAEKALVCWDIDSKQALWRIPLDDRECRALAISPDGQRIAVSCQDCTARVFDVQSKTEIFRGNTHSNQPDYLAFTADGTRLISQSVYENPRLWDMASKKQVLKLSQYAGCCPALSKDRRLAAFGMANGDVVLWDTEASKELHVLRSGTARIFGVAFSPDGKHLAVGGQDKMVRLWDVASGTLLRTLMGHKGRVECVAFSPDGQTLASACGPEIKFWDTSAANNPLQLPPDGEVRAWAFFPDSQRLAVAGWTYSANRRGMADIWNLKTGRRLHTLGPHGNRLEALSLSSDGHLLATAGEERTVKLWNTDEGTLLNTFGTAASEEDQKRGRWGLISVALRGDGKQVAAGSYDGRVTVYNVADGSVVWTADISLPAEWNQIVGDRSKTQPPMHIHALQYTSDGKQLLGLADYGDRVIQIWDADSGRPTFASERLERDAAWAFSGNGRWLAYGVAFGADYKTKNVWLRDLTSAQPARSFGDYSEISALAVSHDGKWLAIAAGKDIDLFDASAGTKRCSMRGHESIVGTLAFLPDGSRLVSGGWDHSVKLWDLVSGQELLNLPLGSAPDERVEHILVSPDGSRIAGTNGFPAGGGPRSTIVVWKSADAALPRQAAVE